ncbi:MAG: hypothetical protein WCG36_03300, partial [bacterium]
MNQGGRQVMFRVALLVLLIQRGAGALPLSELDARFTPLETPVCMDYEVGYRLMNIELSRVARVEATTTIGT